MNFTVVSYALLASVIPSLIWLTFWIREDYLHPEPRSLILKCFIGGALSVVLAIYFEQIVSNNVVDGAQAIISWLSNTNLKYILWAGIEEMCKLAVVLLVAYFSSENDEPIDSMIYFITVALGFAALENTLFILLPLSHGDVIQSISTGSMRFIGAMLVHTLSSATIGFSLGLMYFQDKWKKIVAATIGLVGAIALHSAFNLSIINANVTDTLKTFMWFWAAAVIMIMLFEEIKVVKPREKVS